MKSPGTDSIFPDGTDIAVFMISVLLITTQIVLMQALARTQGHHFAYVVISLALLGFGCSGTLIALTREWMVRYAPTLLPGFILLAGFSCSLTIPGALSMAAATDVHLLFIDLRGWGPLLAAALLLFPLFLCGALFLGLVFMQDAALIGKRYGANLLGSACGSGLGILLLFAGPAEVILPLLALVPAAALLFIPGNNSRAGRRKTLLWAALLILSATLSAATVSEFPRSSYKAFSYALNLPEARVVFDANHPMGQVRIVESPALRYGAGMGLSQRVSIPAAPHIYVNGDEYGSLYAPGSDEPHILDFSLESLPLALRNPEQILVISAGSGAEISHLLPRRDIKQIEVVEPHPLVARLLEKQFRDADPGNRLIIHPTDYRSRLNRLSRRYDLIILPVQGSFGGGIGVQSLQENYLLTRESFRTLWQALEADGLLSVSVYYDQPPRQILKLLTLLVSAMEEAGIETPSQHVTVLRNWDLLTLAASPTPLGDGDRERISRFAAAGPFDRAWVPGIGPQETNGHHKIESDHLNRGFSAILGSEAAAFIEEYPLYVAPPSDDRPYFYRFLRWERLAETRRMAGEGLLAFMEMGSILVGITTALLGAAAFALILVPLLQFRTSGRLRRGTWFVLPYFSALGLGFMFLEILWIQRFTLFWGHPLYSAAGVIAALLFGMGIGSLVAASGITDRSTRLPAVLAVLLCTITAAHLGFPLLFECFSGISAPLKWLVGLAALTAPAFLMGMPFPLALRQVAIHHPHLVPWAWGINGFFSVLGAPVAVIIAMERGFSILGWTAAGAYCIALSMAFFWTQKGGARVDNRNGESDEA